VKEGSLEAASDLINGNPPIRRFLSRWEEGGGNLIPDNVPSPPPVPPKHTTSRGAEADDESYQRAKDEPVTVAVLGPDIYVAVSCSSDAKEDHIDDENDEGDDGGEGREDGH